MKILEHGWWNKSWSIPFSYFGLVRFQWLETMFFLYFWPALWDAKKLGKWQHTSILDGEILTLTSWRTTIWWNTCKENKDVLLVMVPFILG
jgi:hypothetical protein